MLVFLLFVILLLLLLRNILKLFADQRSRALGSRLRSRMLIGAVLISFAPALFMFLFSYSLLNRSIDRWFTQPVSELREDSTRIALDLANYVSLNARAEAESIARAESFTQNYQEANVAGMLDEIRMHRTTLQGGFTVIYRDSAPVMQYQLPHSSQPASVRAWLDDENTPATSSPEPLTATVLRAAQRSDEPILSVGETEYAVGDAALSGGGLVVIGLPMPAGLSATAQQIRAGANQYWTLYRERRSIRTTYLLSLLLLTALVFFSSSWLALYLSKQVTRPVEALADAMNEIGEGQYGTRVTVSVTEELGELIRSFNHMAADLEQSRALRKAQRRKSPRPTSRWKRGGKSSRRFLKPFPAALLRSTRIALFSRPITLFSVWRARPAQDRWREWRSILFSRRRLPRSLLSWSAARSAWASLRRSLKCAALPDR